MKVLKGTLTFVLGMIIGIILFVGAIAGTIFALATAVTVGDLQSKFTDQEVVAKDSKLYGSSIWDAVTGAIDDFQNIDQVTLEKLYQEYGLGVFNGVGGIDFTDKDFYTTPVKTLVNDFSVIVNSFTLRDVGKLTGNDFDSFNLPILKDNLDNNVKTAIDNVLGSIKGDLTIRSIKTNLIPDFNVENDMLKALQDIQFSKFGGTINAFKLCTFIDVNTDSFLPSGDLFVYVKADRYEQVSASDLKNASYSPKDGAETFFFGATDTDGDGKEDTMIEKELRFVNKGTAEEPNFVVDNSCYLDDFNADENTKTFYRHYVYEQYKAGASYPADTEYFVKAYANRVTSFDEASAPEPKAFELYFKGYQSLKDLYKDNAGTLVSLNSLVNAPTINVVALGGGYKKGEDFVPATAYTIKDEEIKKSSKLVLKDFASDRAVYFKVHEGTGSSLLQSVAYLSLAELGEMDDFIKNVKVGDVVDVKNDSPAILKAIKDTTLGGMNDRINTLRVDEVVEINDSSALILKAFKNRGTLVNGLGDAVNDLYVHEVVEINDSSSRLLKSLKKRNCKINELGTVIDDMTIGEIIDVYEFSQVELDAAGEKYLVTQYASDQIGVYVKYDEYGQDGDDRYDFNPDTQKYELAAEGRYVFTNLPTTYVSDANGKYIKSPIVFEEATDAEKGAATDNTYAWQSASSFDATTFAVYVASGNVYFKNGSDYIHNVQLCTYLFNKGAKENLYYRESGAGSIAYQEYDGADLYVKLLGKFLPYDKLNPAHSDLTLYKLHASAQEDVYPYFVRIDDYSDIYVKWNGSTFELGTELDTAIFEDGVTIRFAKQYCETVFVRDNDAMPELAMLQHYVYIDGEYVEYDEEEHQGLDVFVAIPNMYLATQEQVEHLDPSSYIRVSVLNEKSSAVIRMLAGKKINEMSNVVSSAYIDDLMDISPDNMFDIGMIKTSKINDLGSAMSKMMNTMTIGELLDWANITAIHPTVKSAIATATLKNFFKSLTYNSATGEIVVDMVALYGI